MKQAQELKRLQTQRDELKGEITILNDQINKMIGSKNSLKSKLESICHKIEKMSDKEIIVSEHAIIRYMERAMGLNMDEITKQILTPQNKAAIKNMGDGKYPIAEGLKAVVKNNTVLSVY